MRMTFRWYGAQNDSVSLRDIRQIPGMTGIMGFLPEKAAGEIWTEEEIRSYITEVNKAGLACEVIESVNVHEDIKLGLPSRDRYIENYCITIRNLAKYGVKVISITLCLYLTGCAPISITRSRPMAPSACIMMNKCSAPWDRRTL